MSQDAILKLLRQNARLTHSEIADRLGLAEAEVAAVVADLESSGVIIGYQAVVSEENVANEGVSALIEVRVTPEPNGGFDKMAKRIAKFDQVSTCYLMSGGYDLMVVVTGKDLRAVAEFVSTKLSAHEGVLSTATHFRLKAYKENGFLMKTEDESGRLSVSP